MTRDGKKSAQFEETLLVTDVGVEILTAAPSRKLAPDDSNVVEHSLNGVQKGLNGDHAVDEVAEKVAATTLEA